MKLIVQPDDGLAPLVQAIRNAKESIEIVIFRFDRKELEVALADAVTRGVSVQALIAHTNHAGEELLRKLELRMLAAGVTVARTANEFTRYHSKLMIVDRRDLFVLGFNYTGLDIERSRSFGVVTEDPKIVAEAVRLFESDTKRQPYSDGIDGLVVSPANARSQLAAFIKDARRELLIYDVAVTDSGILKLLHQRANAGVDIKIIGGVKSATLTHRIPLMRLHARTIIRDREAAFLGSQSLRKAELESRREVGLIFDDAKAVAMLCEKFDEDWEKASEAPPRTAEPAGDADSGIPNRASKVAKRTAKAITEGLPQVGPMVEEILKEISPGSTDLEIDPDDLQQNVEDAVKAAVKVAVKAAVKASIVPEETTA